MGVTLHFASGKDLRIDGDLAAVESPTAPSAVPASGMVRLRLADSELEALVRPGCVEFVTPTGSSVPQMS